MTQLFTYLLDLWTACHAHIHLFTVAKWPAKRDILGLGTRGVAYDTQIRTRARFLYSAPSHQVSSFYV